MPVLDRGLRPALNRLDSERVGLGTLFVAGAVCVLSKANSVSHAS